MDFKRVKRKVHLKSWIVPYLKLQEINRQLNPPENAPVLTETERKKKVDKKDSIEATLNYIRN